jgi:hypothetical protein
LIVGKKKKGWKPLSSKKIQYKCSVGNEENGYLVTEINKTMINVTKEPSDTHKKKSSKKKSWKTSQRNS